MKRFRAPLAALLIVALVALTALVATAGEEEKELTSKEQFQKQLEEWLPGMGAEKIQDRGGAQQAFQQVCFDLGTPGRENQRKEACEVIVEVLGTSLAKPARIWLLKQLQYIGREESVDAVAKSLDDGDAQVRDAARRALTNIPVPQANAKLLAKLSGSSGTFRVALVNALGYRGDQASVGPLSGLLRDGDQTAASAAANALGKIGGPQAAGALKGALPNVPDALKVRFADAYLRCADRLLKEGKTNEAAAIYNELDTEDGPRVIRLAAIQGKLNAAGDKATDMILDLLESDDADAQQIAAGHVENVIGSGAMQATPENFAKMPASGQVLLLSALATTGERSALPVVVGAAGSNDAGVRLAALRTLATLGDASVVPMLVETIAAAGDTAEPARESLERIVADRVDETIVSEMQKAEDPGMRCLLIEVLDRRRAVVAVPALLKEAAEHKDLGVRSWAMRTLGRLAAPNQAADMVRLLPRIPQGRERDDAEKAIMFVCNRTPAEDQRADPVLSVLGGVGDAEKAVLLPLLGRIGGKKALDSIHGYLKHQNAEVRDAAVRGLCNWPDDTVAGELLAMAKDSDSRSHRIWALRSYIRVVTLPGTRSTGETLGMLKTAMEMATRSDEKKLVLLRAGSVRDVQTLRWVAPYLDNASLAQAACEAVVELAHHRQLREPSKGDFDPALKKVIEICRDPLLVERAKRYLAGL